LTEAVALNLNLGFRRRVYKFSYLLTTSGNYSVTTHAYRNGKEKNQQPV